MKRALVWFFFSTLATGSSHGAPPNLKGPEKPSLGQEFASKAVALSLSCVDTDSPHWDEGQGSEPNAEKLRHPSFFGCFDWHSAVHGHWAMLRAADEVPTLPEKSAIVATLSQHLTTEKLAGELASMGITEKFETPYGFGWGLRLGEELERSKLPEARAWRQSYAPFERKLKEEISKYLTNLASPNRVGVHNNTAFAMIHAWDYAATASDSSFRAFLEERARHFYFADHDCPLALEPSNTDFISPCFVEADLMRRVLSRKDFTAWYDRFLPQVEPAQIRPVLPADPKDYYQVHLVGLMYQKASAMSGVADQLPPSDPRRQVLLHAAAEQTEQAGKILFDSGYGGTHWLASFAIYYYSGVGR